MSPQKVISLTHSCFHLIFVLYVVYCRDLCLFQKFYPLDFCVDWNFTLSLGHSVCLVLCNSFLSRTLIPPFSSHLPGLIRLTFTAVMNCIISHTIVESSGMCLSESVYVLKFFPTLFSFFSLLILILLLRDCCCVVFDWRTYWPDWHNNRWFTLSLIKRSILVVDKSFTCILVDYIRCPLVDF